MLPPSLPYALPCALSRALPVADTCALPVADTCAFYGDDNSRYGCALCGSSAHCSAEHVARLRVLPGWTQCSVAPPPVKPMLPHDDLRTLTFPLLQGTVPEGIRRRHTREGAEALLNLSM